MRGCYRRVTDGPGVEVPPSTACVDEGPRLSPRPWMGIAPMSPSRVGAGLYGSHRASSEAPHRHGIPVLKLADWTRVLRRFQKHSMGQLVVARDRQHIVRRLGGVQRWKELEIMPVRRARVPQVAARARRVGHEETDPALRQGVVEILGYYAV